MPPFDPDAYLAEKPPEPAAAPQPFDPDAYLNQKAAEQSVAPFDPNVWLKQKATQAGASTAQPPAHAGTGAEVQPPPPPVGSPQQVQGNPPPHVPEQGLDQVKQHALDSEAETPGFMEATWGAARRKAVEAATNLALGSQVILPKGVGGLSLEDQYQAGKLHPETKDALDNLLAEPISQGWSNWKWWTAQLAGNLGGVAPGLGAAGAATLVGGPVAGIAGFGAEAAIERVVPAYNAARSAGLDPDSAMKRAIVDSGIAASFAAAMGFAGKMPLTGKVAQELNGVVVDALKRPMLEAFVQLSLVQPGLMAGQDVATALSHGEAPNAEQVLTDMLVGGLAGYGIHRTFRALDQVKGLVRGEGEKATAASDLAIMQAAEAQRPKTIGEEIQHIGEGVGERRGKEAGAPSSEPAAPLGPPAGAEAPEVGESPLTRRALGAPEAVPAAGGIYERELTPLMYDPAVYADAAEVISRKMPERASAKDVLRTLQAGEPVSEERQQILIPQYLEDQRGQISKQDLLNHVEANALRLREATLPDGRSELTMYADPAPGYAAGKFGAGGVAAQTVGHTELGPVGQKIHFVDQFHPLDPEAARIRGSIHEVGVTRLARWATDSGFDQLAMANGDMVRDRGGTPEEIAAADKAIPRAMQKLAKQLGTTVEKVKAPSGRGEVPVLRLTPAMSGVVRTGMMHDSDLKPKAGVKTLSDVVQTNPYPLRLAKAAGKIDQFIRKTSNELGVSRGITFNALPMDTDWRGRVRDGFDPATGNYIIDINTKRILTEHDLYAAASHEFGHVIMHNLFMTAKTGEQAAVFDAFRRFRAKFDPNDTLVGDVRRLRDNAVSIMTGARAMHDGYRLSDLDPNSKKYFLSFEEWFSEQVAKYMQTDAKPLGVADGFFKKVANKIRKMLGFFQKTDPLAGTPDKAIADFLNDRWGLPGGYIEPIKEQFEMDTKKAAAAAFDREGAPETTAVPEQASTGGGRDIVSKLGLGAAGGEAMAAHGDRMNWFYNLFLSLPQVQELNPHLSQLAGYLGMHRFANWEANNIMRDAHQRVIQWGAIRDAKEQLRLTKAIDAYANGLFKLPHTEDGLFRRPNAEEFAAWVKKHDLSEQSVKLFQGMVQDFDKFLENYRTLLIQDARRITDPARQAVNIQNINMQVDKLKSRPFVPLTRFGKYLITVYDSKGNIRHSEQTNSLRRQRQIVEVLKKHPDRLPGDIVLPGEVPKDASIFLGMPPGLIDVIADKLNLSSTQKGVLDQLRFDYAPGQSFKHQFRELDLVPGYSTDFMRNYAHFFHHGARHFTRVRWGDQMRDQINSLASDAERRSRAGNKDGAVRLDKIVKFMQDHYDAWVNPKNDWAGLRGMMFHWYLGFNPASAATNLTQTPLMTYPYLASKYGDVRAIGALLRASTNLYNFYKKGTLVSKGVVGKNTPENFVARALAEMVKRGTISETQAHELAAISEDRNLLRPFGKKGEAGWLKFQEASSWMFEMTEQYNRRLAARAALDLGYAHPDHAEVKAAVAENGIIYKELTDPKGMNWTPQEAGAFLAAQRAVNHTQFEYAQYARPRVMRGAIGSTALVFKLFGQNTMFNLISNPAMLGRWLVVMGALGGLQGMMGFENVNSLIKTLAYRLFGKDFDLEDEARHFAHDVVSEKYGPDLLMHGLSAQGFGIPAVMHSLGMNWVPTVDMSKAVGFGDLLGFDPLAPLGATKNPKEEELRQITRASGAAFGLPLSIYDFASSNQNFTDLKKYEAIAPKFLGNLSHAYRWATQGKEVNAAGNAVVRFNVADTQQMMEILARIGGFQPRRLTAEWAYISAVNQSAAFYDLRRQGLLRQFAETVKTQDPENRARVTDAIKKFNHDLPPEARAKAITTQQLQSSIQQRLRVQQMQESGLPAQKSNVPIAREMEKYYPRGQEPTGLQSVKPVQ